MCDYTPVNETACIVQVYSNLQAGTYRFSAMLTGQQANQAAQASFVVDTIGPAVSISAAPASITNGGLVDFVFSSEAAAYFQCRTLNVGATAMPDFETCVSPKYVSVALPTTSQCVFYKAELLTSGYCTHQVLGMHPASMC